MRLFVLLSLTLLAPLAHAAPAPATSPAVHYTLRFPAPQTHYFEVEAQIPTQGADTLEVFMPVWAPGSYLVREFSRHVEHVRALDTGGRPLPVAKSAKNRWQITSAGTTSVHLHYRVYGNEMSVRTNFVDADLAMLSPPATFISPVLGLDRPYTVTIERPKAWRSAHTSLEKTAPDTYRAPDFDTLIDSPIVAGTPTVEGFTIDGIEHALITFDADERFDPARATRDLAKLVATHRTFWGRLPDYEHYLFLNMLVGRGGGLEHSSSTVIMGHRRIQQTPADYENWLRLVSHEFFHAWNVKRLRPETLGPFDYERENHTESLWIAEGITSYYDTLLARRAGLVKDALVLERLSKKIAALQAAPGRTVRSLALASYDAWIRYYRPDENSANTNISYYTKGSVVAFLLDAEIRQRTKGTKSLDHVMRAAWAKLGAKGYTPEGFTAVINDVTGSDLTPWIAAAVDGTGELDYTTALKWWGLRFKPIETKPDAPRPGWLGLKTSDEPRATITQVRADGPAHLAGLNVGDELLAIDNDRVPPEWSDALKHTTPGQTAQILVSRRGSLRRIPVKFAAPPKAQWTLEVDPKASKAQSARFKAWMAGPGR